MSHLDQRLWHILTNTLHFLAPTQRDWTIYSNRPSRFGELLKKMVMTLYVFKIFLFLDAYTMIREISWICDCNNG